MGKAARKCQNGPRKAVATARPWGARPPKIRTDAPSGLPSNRPLSLNDPGGQLRWARPALPVRLLFHIFRSEAWRQTPGSFVADLDRQETPFLDACSYVAIVRTRRECGSRLVRADVQGSECAGLGPA
jgi:hypothetical protein